MSTKAKCLALAKKHNMEIWIGEGYNMGYGISIPEGFSLEDYEFASTGLSSWGFETKKQLWQECYEDLQTCLSYKPWFKIPEEWK